ncbi:hypothetical protein [Amphritea sp.]|uniref:hypothetical protein n=1 Tax=Amphritea sp. TaxID=1872502 RepID=UPI0025BE8041|nr:hypothetical protein [Amphritea sp.]
MKTTVFTLTDMTSEMVDPQFQIFDGIFKVPSLPAYAVLHHHLDYDHSVFGESAEKPQFYIKYDVVRICRVPSLCVSFNKTATLTVSYSGIRDYAMLFPHIKNEGLQQRLGQFAEEAEKAFDACAWMSFVLMAGAVIEGLLVGRFGNNKNFKTLIQLANEAGVLGVDDLESIQEVREARNRVHAERFDEPFIERLLAMDVYVIFDRLLKRRWDLDK